jgi:Uncharacterized protein conserved in bacteria
MLITHLQRSSGGNEVTLLFENRESYTISAADFRKAGIPDCKAEELPFELNDKTFSQLELLQEKLNAVKYATYLLGFSDKSVKKLLQKMKEKGYSDHACALAVEAMKHAHILDDLALCKRKLLFLANTKLYGKYRIKQELFVLGFDRETVENALENSEVDYEQNAVALFQKIARNSDLSDRMVKKKLSDKMGRYGYGYDLIKICLENEIDEEFE